MSWPWRARITFLEYVFHPRANSLFPFRVREDVELVLAECPEDGIGDLHRRHSSRHQLAEGFPPCSGYRTERLRRRKVLRTVARRLHDPCVDNPRTEYRDLDFGPALGQVVVERFREGDHAVLASPCRPPTRDPR